MARRRHISHAGAGCLVAMLVLGRPAYSSASVDWGRVHDLTVHGLNRLYSLEVDDAMQAFDSVSNLAPGDPRGKFFQSMVHFYLYGLNRE